MSARLAMQVLEAGRVVIGGALVAAPVAAAEPWIGDAAHTPGGQVAVRALGIRDAVLGVGALAAATRGDAATAARWAAALAVCDVVDGLATIGARSELPSRGVPVTAIALGAAATGFAVAAALRD